MLRLDDLQKEIFLSRYAMAGEQEWHECARRVARHVSQAEMNGLAKQYEDLFFEYINDGTFIPGGRILFGSGRHNYNLLNCFRLHPADTVSSIGQTIKETYQISCGGGGIGFNFSDIRPRGDDIQNIRNSAPGSVSVMQMIDEIGKHVRAGKNRRTALIAILDVTHPDLLDFLHVKLDLGQLSNFNISVGITNRFIEAVQNDEEWYFTFNNRQYYLYQAERVDGFGTSHAVHLAALSSEDAITRLEQHCRIKATDTFKNARRSPLKAREIWEAIIFNSWKCGDPGIYNIDMANTFTNVNYFEDLASTNPCGEIPLPPYGNCCLGHINLASLYNEKKNDVDWKKLAKAVHVGIRFLDNVLTVNSYPVPRCKEVAEQSRRIGLGVTGLHYLLIRLGLEYGTENCLQFLERLFATIRNEAYKTSVDLALEKGAFPEFDKAKYLKQEFCKKLPQRIRAAIRQHGIRNAVMLTVAPTGCQNKNSLIISNKGILRLGEMIDHHGEQWQDLNNYNIIQERKSSKATRGYINGFSDTLKIKLESGIVLESTYNHKYRVVDFDTRKYIWKRADELKIDDAIAIKMGGYSKEDNYQLTPIDIEKFDQRYHQEISFPREIDEVFAKWLGYYFADGSNHKRSIRIHCNKNDKAEIAEIIELTKQCFNINIRLDESRNKSRGDQIVTVCINSRAVKEFLRINGLTKQKSRYIKMPLGIRLSSNTSISSFINGYWSADGSHTGNTDYIDTTSFRMAQDIAICSRALGHNIRIGEYRKVKGSFGKKVKYRIYFKKFGSVDQEHSLRYCKKYLKQENEIASSHGVFYDKVKSIRKSQCVTMDLEVPENNTYTANSVISHNTTSIVLGVSSGIEPIFAPVYERTYREGSVWKTTSVVDPLFKEFILQGKDVSHIIGAHDISVRQHLATQATIQQYIDSSISKTINIPEEFDHNELSDVLLEYIGDLKGVTLYRTNSRGIEPLKPIKLTDKIISQIQNSDVGITSIETCKNGLCEL